MRSRASAPPLGANREEMQELLAGMREEYARKLPEQLTRIESLWREMAGGIDMSNAAYSWVKDVQTDETIGGMRVYDELPARLAAVTVDQVAEAARRMLSRSNQTIGWFEPLAINGSKD